MPSRMPLVRSCFNLVIEVLFVSSQCLFYLTMPKLMSFNLVIEVLVVSSRGFLRTSSLLIVSFNLVIEVLVVSRKCPAPQIFSRADSSFNLVIEVLVVSSLGYTFRRMGTPFPFQSRNRGTCRFKATEEVVSVERQLLRFQSRNRGTCRFKIHDHIRENWLTDEQEWFQSRNRGTCRFKLTLK